jgi:predicted Zn-dependent protease
MDGLQTLLRWTVLGFAGVLVLFGVLLRPEHAAAEKLTFIRDTEIEDTIRSYAAPVFVAAGLDPNAVRIYLVNDNSLNAFVAGGQNLFLNTGLLLKTAHAGQVIGVIAHETGHIAGGHLARIHDQLRNSTAESILAFVLGAAAAAAGRPDVGSAVILGGQNIAVRSLLQYSRTQESAADAAATQFLDATGQSAKGFLEFMQVLERQELMSPSRQDPYLRTHPLSQDRVEALAQFVAHSPNSDVPVKPAFQAAHGRMVAKLHAFLETPEATFQRYPESDTSLEARYARAIAYFRIPDLPRAIAAIDELIAEHPSDPYFHELKGQMLFENGRPKEALAPYDKAVRMLPDAPLLRTDLARVQLALNDPKLLDPAIVNLRAAIMMEPKRSFVWRELAIAYGRNNQPGESALALAEEALLQGRKKDARFQAGKAAGLLPAGSPAWLQAQDILESAKEEQN